MSDEKFFIGTRGENGSYKGFSESLKLADFFDGMAAATLNTLAPVLQKIAETSANDIAKEFKKERDGEARKQYNALIEHRLASHSLKRQEKDFPVEIYRKCIDVKENLWEQFQESDKMMSMPHMLGIERFKEAHAWLAEHARARRFEARGLIFLHLICIYIDAKADFAFESLQGDAVIGSWIEQLNEVARTRALNAMRYRPDDRSSDGLILALALCQHPEATKFAEFVGDFRSPAELFVEAFRIGWEDSVQNDFGPALRVGVERRRPFEAEIGVAMILRDFAALTAKAKKLIEDLVRGQVKDREDLNAALLSIVPTAAQANWPPSN